MRILCFFCGIISFCSSLAAVGFIWVRPLLLALCDDCILAFQGCLLYSSRCTSTLLDVEILSNVCVSKKMRIIGSLC